MKSLLATACAVTLVALAAHPLEAGPRHGFKGQAADTAKSSLSPVMRDHRARPAWSRQRCGLEACPWRPR